MADSLTKAERSALMARVRWAGNESTERLVETCLRRAGIKGFKKHPANVLGRPDFYFPRYRLAVFVDGCFWHCCPSCGRRIPKSNTTFWKNKIDENRRRDNRIRRKLHRLGYHVVRIWEHDAKRMTWLDRLRAAMKGKGRA
jgi:DNA mismatch endonuclease (patch repair protein)